MPPETDYAWAAGIIDGEGSVAMTKANPGINRRVTLSFQIRISVRMTHEATILRLHHMFGGTFKPSKSRNPSRHKACFEWYVGDLDTVRVLRLVVPYLTTKLPQATLLLEYRKMCAKPVRRRVCSDELTALRLSYFERLRILNYRGVMPK